MDHRRRAARSSSSHKPEASGGAFAFESTDCEACVVTLHALARNVYANGATEPVFEPLGSSLNWMHHIGACAEGPKVTYYMKFHISFTSSSLPLKALLRPLSCVKKPVTPLSSSRCQGYPCLQASSTCPSSTVRVTHLQIVFRTWFCHLTQQPPHS